MTTVAKSFDASDMVPEELDDHLNRLRDEIEAEQCVKLGPVVLTWKAGTCHAEWTVI